MLVWLVPRDVSTCQALAVRFCTQNGKSEIMNRNACNLVLCVQMATLSARGRKNTVSETKPRQMQQLTEATMAVSKRNVHGGNGRHAFRLVGAHQHTSFGESFNQCRTPEKDGLLSSPDNEQCVERCAQGHHFGTRLQLCHGAWQAEKTRMQKHSAARP